MLEDLRIIAVSRLFLRPWIRNIQTSWVKLGTKMAQMALLGGANDFGGTLMEESISRESGSQHGENLSPEVIRKLIREVGRVPVERSTDYHVLRRFEQEEVGEKSEPVDPKRTTLPIREQPLRSVSAG